MRKNTKEISDIDKEIVSTLIETGAINFEAIGNTIAKVGPSSMYVADGWERWCGSDLRIYRWPRRMLEVEELMKIKEIIGELRR